MPDFGQLDHLLRELGRALAALSPVLAEDRLGAEFVARGLGDDVEFAVVVAAEMVDGDDDGQAELADIGDVAAEIGEARLHRCIILLAEIGLGDAALRL